MSTKRDRTLSDMTDPVIAPFWEACRRHVLTIQKCEACGDVRFPPLAVCPNCWSDQQAWVEAEPAGKLWSYVIYHRAMDPAFADQVPYAIGRVKTTSGPVFETRLDIPFEEITIGMPVVATFRDVSEDFTLLEFSKS